MTVIQGLTIYTPAVKAADEDALTMMLAAADRLALGAPRPDRLGLASTSLPYARRVQAGLIATALDLPAATFCLECTTSARAATEAIRALGTGLILAADGAYAAALLLGEAGPGLGTIRAARGALAEYPGLAFTPAGATGLHDVAVPDYAEAAYLELVRAAAEGLRADRLALNPPTPRLGRIAARALGFAEAVTAPPESGAAGPLLALHAALAGMAPGQTLLLVSYGAGSAADALVIEKGGS
jgi:hydroxymethylglutaryl-CoA synthase